MQARYGARQRAKLEVPPTRLFQIGWSPRSCTVAVTFQQAAAVEGSVVTWSLVLLSTSKVMRREEIADVVPEGSGGFSFSPCGNFLAALLTLESGRAVCLLDVRATDTRPHCYHVDLAAAAVNLPEAVHAAEVWDDQPSQLWQWLPCPSSAAGLARLAVWLPDDSSARAMFRGAVVLSFGSGNHEPHRLHLDWGSQVHRPVWGLSGLVALDITDRATVLIDQSLGLGPAVRPDPDSSGHGHAPELTWQPVSLEDVSKGYQWRWDRVSPGTAYAWSRDTCFLAVACCNGFREQGQELMVQLVDGRCGTVRSKEVLLKQPNMGFLIRRLRVEWSQDSSRICVTVAMAHLKDFNAHSVRKYLLSV